MKSSKLVEILKKGNFVVPFYLFQLKDKFNISFDSFIFLIYLSNLGTNIIFDPNRFTTDLGLSMELILSYIDELSEKKYISIDVIKNDKGVMEEYVILDLFYEKVTNLMIDDINQAKIEEEKNSNIYEAIEKEFARPLTSIEYEIISAWLEDGTSEELILEALKEAVYSGVCNLRYIDKILYEWSRKGIKTIKDVEENRKKRNVPKDKESDIDLDTIEWNWFDEDE